MRRTTRFTALILALVLALTLAGCGSDSFESAMVRALREMQDVESVHADMALDMAFGFDALGESSSMDISMDMDMDTAGDLTSGELTMTLFGFPITAAYIAAKDGDTYDLYISMDGGETWQSQLDLSEEQLMNGANRYNLGTGVGDMVSFYLEFASNFGEAVDETVDGVECSRYDGVFPGAQLTEALALSGGSSLAEIPEGTTLPDAPISFWLAKADGLPRRITLDMTEAMGQYMTGVLSESGVSEDLVSVTRIGITVDLSEYNTAEPMQVPAV